MNRRTANQLQGCYENGMKARRDGKTVDECPYRILLPQRGGQGPARQSHWIAGWKRQDEIIRAMNDA